MKGAGLRFASRSAKWAAIIVHARFSVGREMRQDLSFAAVAFLLMCSHAAIAAAGINCESGGVPKAESPRELSRVAFAANCRTAGPVHPLSICNLLWAR